MTDGTEKELQQSKPKQISRRKFLKLAAAATVAIGGLGGGLNLLSGSKTNIQETSISPEDALKQEIESRFNVELLNLRDLWDEAGLEYPDNNPRPDFAYYRNVPKSWDLERLNLLKEGLSNLPPSMYLPNNEGKKLRIVLSYISGINAAFVKENGEVRQKKVPNSHILELDHREFRIGSAKEPFEILAHELTHITTPMTMVSDQFVDNGKIYPFEKIISPWFDKMYEILDRNFFAGKPTAVRNQLKQFRTTNTNPDKEYFYQTLDYALKNNFDPNEFIGVMGQSYTHGYDYFSSMYGIFFPPEIVTKLYNFIRDEVYNGKEFSRFPTESYHDPTKKMED